MFYKFAIFILLIQSVLFLGHWFFYRTFIFFFKIQNHQTILYLKITLFILSLSLVISSIFAFNFYNYFVNKIYLISSIWLGIGNFFLAAGILSWFFYFIFQKTGISLDSRIIGGIFFGLAVVVSIYGIFNAKNIRVSEISVKLPNISEYWKEKKVLWVSDIHLGPIGDEIFAKKLVNKINNLKPSAIFIGGDLFDGETPGLEKLSSPFAGISAPDGVYFITGNHEEFFDGPDRYLDIMKDTDIKILDNKMVNLKGLQIIGVDYKDSENKDKFKEILEELDIKKDLPSILLKHSPSLLDVSKEGGISMQISGHTHVGQIFPMSLLTSFVYKGYDYGFKDFNGMKIYTSSGAGTWGPPMRVGSVSEIVLINFE